MSINVKTLVLVRHAKSSWENPSLSDRRRPLAPRGHKAAPIMAARLGQHLQDFNLRLDHIVCSPALRARSTASYMAEGLGFDDEEVEEDAELYFCGAATFVAVAKSLSNRQHCVMLVGHNPDISSALELFTGEFHEDLPTCAVAIVQWPVDSWQLLGEESGQLQVLDYPKKKIPQV